MSTGKREVRPMVDEYQLKDGRRFTCSPKDALSIFPPPKDIPLP